MRFSQSILLVCFCLVSMGAQAGGWADWWATPDQQGQRLFDQGKFAEAAETFVDPGLRASAFYRAGDFETAASVFGRIGTAQGSYNRGNSLLMLGRYDEAIKAYEQALEWQPDWPEATENLLIAQERKEKLAPPDSDDGGTGGMLEADDYVFDDTGRVNRSGQDEVTQGGQAMSDEEMRSVWLRRVQNDPAGFLSAKFAYQLYRDQKEGE